MRSLLTKASTVGAKTPKSWLTAFLATRRGFQESEPSRKLFLAKSKRS